MCVCSSITLERLERLQPNLVHIWLYVCIKIYVYIICIYVYIYIIIRKNKIFLLVILELAFLDLLQLHCIFLCGPKGIAPPE
jgi:hypothetical protein